MLNYVKLILIFNMFDKKENIIYFQNIMPNFLEVLFETLVKKINSGIIIVPIIIMFIESLILNN
jgi:hypothetical protein